MSRNFKKEIPDELVAKFFNVVGLRDLSDMREYTKEHISPKAMQDFFTLIPDVAPYLCARIIQREHTPKTMCSLLKILAEHKGYEVIVRIFGKDRKIYYSLHKRKHYQTTIPID